MSVSSTTSKPSQRSEFSHAPERAPTSDKPRDSSPASRPTLTPSRVATERYRSTFEAAATARPSGRGGPTPTATPGPTPGPTPTARPTPTGTPTATPAAARSSQVGPVQGPVSEPAADGLIVGGDGKLYGRDTPVTQVPGTQPRPGVIRNNEQLLYVNGIQNDVGVQQQSMQAIANQTGSTVVGIHNSTGSFLGDVGQCLMDKQGLDWVARQNPATATMANAIMTNLRNDTPTHIMAHSQGALITSNALTLVKNQLDHDAQLPGAAGAEARQLLGRFNNIKVETFGGAAASYPKGPQYVHYVNTRDPVAMVAGLPSNDDFILHDINADSRPGIFNPFDRALQNAAGGEGAVVHYIHDYRGGITDPFANHDFMESNSPNLESGGYIAQRVPFEEAQRSQFHDVDTGLPN